jgi:hypothetical protein
MFVKHYVPIYLVFDLEGWPWPWPFTSQNVQLHEIHMHAKYQVAIFNIAKVYIKWAILTHIYDLWPWRMTLTLTFQHWKCAAPWDTHACHIWSCVNIFNIAKVMANVKVWRKQTNTHTNKKATNQQTGQKQYVPQYSGRGHKNSSKSY